MKKEIPILFSTPMVQAILEGRKTMTRRVLKPQPLKHNDIIKMPINLDDYSKALIKCAKKGYKIIYTDGILSGMVGPKLKYKAGDLLWVRETWANSKPMTEIFSGRKSSLGIVYKAGRLGTTYPHNKPEGGVDINRPETKITDGFDKYPLNNKWKPGIHMPKEACRIWLEISGIKVERLHDISEEDAKAEGIEYKIIPNQNPGFSYKNYINDGFQHLFPKESFTSLWLKINGKESWDLNPWVWVISFKVLSTTGMPKPASLPNSMAPGPGHTSP